MNDVRLVAWLEATERALEAPDADIVAALETARKERASLMEALARDPARPATPELAGQLTRAETAFARRIDQVREEIGQRVRELRRVRSGTGGYRQVGMPGPSLISDDA